MKLSDVRTRTEDGIKWYLASDLTMVLGVSKVGTLSDALKLFPKECRVMTDKRTDWRYRQRRLWISSEGVLILATRFGDLPMIEVRKQLMGGGGTEMESRASSGCEK